MEQQVQSHNNYLMFKLPVIIVYFTLLILNSCSFKSDINSVNWDNGTNFTIVNGLMLENSELFTGEILKMYDNQTIQSKTHFVAGKKHGSFNTWHSNGDIFESREYAHGFKIGIHQGWWPNSKQKFIYNFNELGQYEGELLEWSITGQSIKIMNYKNGKEAGHQRIWDSEGIIKSNYTAINGDRFGLVNMKNCYSVDNETNEVSM